MVRGPLQEFLAECARDGDFDSSGEFTLDSELARRKLARYHEADPDNFLVQWVRFACLCSATRTSVVASDKDLLLAHDGSWPTLGEARSLYGYERGPCRALAYCVWNALRYRYSEVHLVTPEGELRLSDKGETLHEEVLPPQVPKGKGKESPPVFLKMLARRQVAKSAAPLPAPGKKQLDLLRQRCRYAPVEIEFLGQRVEGPRPHPCVMHAWLAPKGSSQPADSDPADQVPPALRCRWPRARTDSCHTLVTRESYRASLFIGVRGGAAFKGSEGGVPESLHLVLDGVCYEAPLPWRLPRVLVVLSCPGLRLDLSGDRLVRNDAYQAVMAGLVVDLDRFFRQAVTDIDAAPAGLVPYLEALISVRLRSRDYKSAYEICRWVFLKGMGPKVRKDFSTWQRASFLYRFALVSQLMQDPHSARVSAQQAEAEWSKAPLKDERWLPHSHESPAELTAAERILLCRMAVEVQTLEKGAEKVRAPLLALIATLESKRWGAAVYCLRWLVELDAGIYPKGHRRIAVDLGRLGCALVRANQAQRNPTIERWQEARYVLASATEGWGYLAPATPAAESSSQAPASTMSKGWLADAALFTSSLPQARRRPAEADMPFLLTLLELQIVVDGHLGDFKTARQKMRTWLAEMENHDQAEVATRARLFRDDLRGSDPECLALLDEKLKGLPRERVGPRAALLNLFRSRRPLDPIPEDDEV